MHRQAAIVGIGRTAYNRASGRTPSGMAAEASRNALADAGLTTAGVDGGIDFGTGDSVRAMQLGYALGVDDLAFALDNSGGGNVAAATVATAFSAVSRGLCEVAVVYRSLNGRSGNRYGRGDVPPVALEGEMQFAATSGFIVPPMWFAMFARRHQEIYGSTAEDLGRIAITQRAHAVPNEHAQQRTPLTMDDYLVITTLDRARDLPHPPVRLLAEAEAHTFGGSVAQFGDLTTMYSAYAAPRLWSRTDLGPADVDVACMYDCFTFTVMATFEDFGFCDKGEVGDFFADGRATYGGDVVVNPHGGLLSEGYLHGLNHHTEAVLQLRGAGGDRQVTDAEIALVTAGAGPYGGAVLYGWTADQRGPARR